MQRRKHFNRFKLQQQTVFNNQIRTKAYPQIVPAIIHRNLNLPNIANATLRQFTRKRPLIHRLQQPWSQIAMNINRRTQHGINRFVRAFLQLLFSVPSVLSVARFN